MANLPTLLIAEDNNINRSILVKILSPEYQIIETANGRQALEKLHENRQAIAAVILDLLMPVMDGFGFLKEIQGKEEFRNIPIIVATGNVGSEHETKALELGAWDFVSKPYDAKILKFRLRNAIERSRLFLFNQLKYQAEFDSLTGLYNKRKFYRETRKILDLNRDEKFVFVRFDIDRFQLFNAFFGMEEGDHFLQYIARTLTDAFNANSCATYGRIEADVFACCASYPSEDAVLEKLKKVQGRIRSYTNTVDIVTIFGLYYLDDLSLPVNEMLDRAALAAKTCKGKYLETVAVYTPKLSQNLEQEQEIINEMSTALEQKQFCVYFQPKYDLSTNRPQGAEALVRWKHPQKGMLSPGVFIPVIEKNGFIAKVDYYVWELVCQFLQQWQRDGIKPQPVSVNISRVNLYNPQIVEIITGLTEKYQIPPELLQLELTESAYMDNPTIMKQVVRRLQEKGFTVLMDDFGSGYSSLNTLKNIDVDILKIDMKFLPTGENNCKSEKILATMIRMAAWLGMPVVVEGVETQEQKEFLESVGCRYVQGYYFARPMAENAYVNLISENNPEQPEAVRKEDPKDLNLVWSAAPKVGAFLRSISVPVAFYEYENGEFERLRANKSFLEVFGGSGIRRGKRLADSELIKIRVAFEQAVTGKSFASCEYFVILENGIAKWFRLKLQYVRQLRSSHILCGVFTETTDEKRIESELLKIKDVLEQPQEKKASLMVVDDSRADRELLGSLFQEDFEILTASNGEEALRLLQDRRRDIAVVLLDMQRPEINGTEFLSQKKYLEQCADIPVVIISADSDAETQINMLRNGVNDYITKPFVPEVLQRRVHNVLEYSSRFSALVHEYREAIASQPDLEQDRPDDCYTAEKIHSMIGFLLQIFDVVRLVDPADTSVLYFDESGCLRRKEYSCFQTWRKGNRCENCTSDCAMRCNCQMTKYEFIENSVFYMVSRPLSLVRENEEPLRVVLEIASHVSDHLLMQRVEGKPIRQLLEETQKKIYCDELTFAYNRRYFSEMLFLHHGKFEIARQIALIMLDINGMKEINDSFGHCAGDEVLRSVSKAILEAICPCDCLIRYGGDEFIIVLTGRSREQSMKAVPLLRDAVGKVRYGPDGSAPVSAEFGCAYAENFEPSPEYLKQMVKEADAAMYRKKRRRPLAQHGVNQEREEARTG